MQVIKNKQAVIKKPTTHTSLPVMEMFYSIQGEGLFVGTPAFFVRLAGCDVGCPWCDVKESWDSSIYPSIEIQEITEQLIDTNCKTAIITGGEPCLHSLKTLTTSIQNQGVATHLETSGSSEITGNWDWITLSPKKYKPTKETSFKQADELKIVIANHQDLRWAEKNALKVQASCKLYLQPEWSCEKEILPMVIAYAKKHPKWRISLQTHKYMNIE